MPQPLPFAELLDALEDRGLTIGMRERLRVAKLIERWETLEEDSLRNAFAALLARTPEEVKRVHQEFDDLYREPSPGGAEVPVDPAATQPTDRSAIRPPWYRWVWLSLAVAALVASLLWYSARVPRDLPPDGAEQTGLGPEPSQAPNKVDRQDWGRALLGTAAGVAVLLLGLYLRRLRRAAGARAREDWLDQADSLPEPLGYDLVLGNPPLPVPASVLDEMASLLGRHSAAPPRGGDLDVERTLDRTLRAGLAPVIVLRAPAASAPVLVLEEMGSDMLPWRGRVRALLDGLEARGVILDRWVFDPNSGRAEPSRDGEELALKELFRRRAEGPLLIVSPGNGSLDWATELPAWLHRAWLQPVADRGYWNPLLREGEIPVFPMSPGGVLAAAWHLARRAPGRSDREGLARLDERPVAPLDIDRMRWLLELAPRRDADLAELMRRRFFPRIPQASLLEALDAPPLSSPPPGAPPAAEVHAFLAGILEASRPAPGTTAHERWRLDRAVQNAFVPGREWGAARELSDLASGHLAAEVEPAVERLTGRAVPTGRVPSGLARWLLRWRVLFFLRMRAERQGLRLVQAEGWSGQPWRRPRLSEVGAALLGGASLFLVLGFLLHKEVPVTTASIANGSVSQSEVQETTAGSTDTTGVEGTTLDTTYTTEIPEIASDTTDTIEILGATSDTTGVMTTDAGGTPPQGDSPRDQVPSKRTLLTQLDEIEQRLDELRDAVERFHLLEPFDSRLSKLRYTARILREALEESQELSSWVKLETDLSQLEGDVTSLAAEFDKAERAPLGQTTDVPTTEVIRPLADSSHGQAPPTNVRYSKLVPINCKKTALDLILEYELAENEKFVSGEIEAIETNGTISVLPEKVFYSSFLGLLRSATGRVTFHSYDDSHKVRARPNNTSCSAKVRLKVIVEPRD